MTTKISTVVPGQRVHAGYRQWATPCTFQGFTLSHTEEPRWPELKAVYMSAGCTNLKGLEAWADAKGVTVRAVFQDVEHGDRWAAYLYKGRFCVGTSADRLELS